MNTKFTPGPWRALYDQECSVETDNGEIVVICPEYKDLNRWDEEEHNVKLIAAAPDMLSSLVRLAHGIEEIMNSYPPQYKQHHNARKSLDQVSGIIKKATGRSWEELKENK